MYKKIITSLLISFSLLKALEVPLNINKISVDYLDGKSYFFTPVTDISYTQLQDAIRDSSNDNAVIYVYRWYQQSGIMEAVFGVSILGAVEITKDNVKYWLKHTTGKWESYETVYDFKKAVDEYEDKVTKNKEKFYTYPKIEAFTKLKGSYQYVITPMGMDLTITYTLPNNNPAVNDSLIYPPTPPVIGGN